MIQKSLIIPERQRLLKPPFAWIDRRFMFHGFFAELSSPERLLYFFLILVADRDGLSYYYYDKICQILQIDVDTYIQARNGLIRKNLIAFNSPVFQVLSLPERKNPIHARDIQRTSLSTISKQDDFKAMATILEQLKNR